MVYLTCVTNQSIKAKPRLSFGQNEKNQEQTKPAKLLFEERKLHPIKTTAVIEGEKLKNAFTIYPIKGLQGSKNSNFYEYLTEGKVPYIIGTGTLIAGFNATNKYFDQAAKASASKLGKSMAVGAIGYGVLGKASESLIEVPLNYKYGIDVNLPYRKKVDELPEERNKDNLVAYEYHKVFESVDFPYWDLLYNNKYYGEERNAYFKTVGKKLGFKDEELLQADQKVKPAIKEKVDKAKLATSLSAATGAAMGVALGVQEPFNRFNFNPITRFKDFKNGIHNRDFFVFDFIKTTTKSFKEMTGWGVKKLEMKHKAGRVLAGIYAGTIAIGNFLTLNDFNKYRSNSKSNPLIDDTKEKVVC